MFSKIRPIIERIRATLVRTSPSSSWRTAGSSQAGSISRSFASMPSISETISRVSSVWPKLGSALWVNHSPNSERRSPQSAALVAVRPAIA